MEDGHWEPGHQPAPVTPLAPLGFRQDHSEQAKVQMQIEKQKAKLARLKKAAREARKKLKSAKDGVSDSDVSADSDESVFRETKTKKEPDPTSQKELLAKAQKHPGELARELLEAMHETIVGPSLLDSAGSQAPPVARSFYLNFLSRKFSEKEKRSKRELFTLTTLLDQIRSGRYSHFGGYGSFGSV